MDKLLKKLFDYQKFAQNENLDRVIKQTAVDHKAELLDEQLFAVAGGKKVDEKKEDN